MVSALDSRSRGPGSSPGRGHLCCVLGKDTSLSVPPVSPPRSINGHQQTQEYKWVPANCHGNLRKCWVTCDDRSPWRWTSIPPRRSSNPGGVLPKNYVGVCGPLSKTLTLFMAKICDFPYPIYDLTKNLIPYL